MSEKNNIVFKCFYYKPKEKYNSQTQADKIKKREFLSCSSSYNYVSYVDTGAATNYQKTMPSMLETMKSLAVHLTKTDCLMKNKRKN